MNLRFRKNLLNFGLFERGFIELNTDLFWLVGELDRKIISYSVRNNSLILYYTIFIVIHIYQRIIEKFLDNKTYLDNKIYQNIIDNRKFCIICCKLFHNVLYVSSNFYTEHQFSFYLVISLCDL